MKILTQIEAEHLNSKFFFTGVPCGNGHISKRYTSCGVCLECVENRREKRRDYLKEQSREYWRRNPEKHRANWKAWRKANHEYVKKYTREYAVMWRKRKKAEFLAAIDQALQNVYVKKTAAVENFKILLEV